MFLHSPKKDIFTVPNLLSLFRLMLIPVYGSVYLQAAEPEEFYAAGLLMTLSCLTDLADGWIARRFNMASRLGQILDPLADKLTQLSLTMFLSIRYPRLKQIMALLVIKELVQLFLALYYYHRGKVLPGALMAGKVCTTVLFVSLITMAVFPDLPNEIAGLLTMSDGVFLLFSFLQYWLAYLGPHPVLKDVPTE